MRKLKTLLILMFAASLSLTLFACGGKKNKGSETLYSVQYDEEITIDDTYDETKWATYLETVTLEGITEDGDEVEIKGSECDITGTINFHTTDRYVTTFTPKNNNENNVDVQIIVVIDHAWGEEAEGVSHCQYAACGATRTAKDEDVAMHYGNFHYGTGVSPLGNPTGWQTALPEVALSEEAAADLTSNDWFANGATYHQETTPTGVFSNDAGITDAGASTRIKAFGQERSGKQVPTVTAGDLTPGMSITIEGFAKTDVVGGTKDTAVAPWNATNGNWNAPSYGIADAYAKTGDAYGYGGGNSVIVRSEGWVLYNGIGQQLNNTLGGVPAEVAGGGAYQKECGDTEDSNCASLVGATDDILEGQDLENRPQDYTSDDWKTWWVYSEGTERRSLLDYQSYLPVRVTWTYRTYKLDPEDPESEKIGIIMIESEYLSEGKSGTMLRSYIKVPTPSRGSYRTIIHGDYSSLIITKSTYVETETVTDMRILDETQENARTAYLAGETIDAVNVFKMEIQSEQNSAWHDGGISVTNDMLYYYKGTGTTYAEAEAAIDTEADWEAVGDQPLTAAMKYFKVVLTRADDTFSDMVAENLISVTANNVKDAVGDAYATEIDSADPMAKYDRNIGEGTDVTYVDLTIDKAIFRAVPAAATFKADATEGYSYATLRIRGLAAFGIDDSEHKEQGTVKSGEAGADETYYYNYKKAGNDVLVAIAIKQSMLGQALLIDGVQDTDIRITFGTNSIGFAVTSTSGEYTPFALNKGGEVTVTYKNIGRNQFILYVYNGNTSLGFLRSRNFIKSDTQEADTKKLPAAIADTGFAVKSYTNDGSDATIVFTVPAFDLANWTEMPFIRLQATINNVTQTTDDYIEYARTFETTTSEEATKNYQSEGGTYFYAADGKLYFASVAKNITTAGEEVDITTIAKGGNTVNINDGNAETAKASDLSYAYDGKSAIAFANDGYNTNEAYGIKTLLLDKAYGDYGLIVIASIDPAALGFTGDFGFQISGVEQSEAHYWKYNATAKTISYEKITTSSGMVVVAPGDCFTAGIVASKVMNGDDVVFLADYKEVGGRHISDGNGHCKLCGGTLETKSVAVWASTTMYDMKDGQILDMTVTYPDSGEITAGGGNYGFVWTALANGHRYWTLTDGQMQKIPGDSEWGNRKVPYDETERPEGEQDMWTSLPANVLNGQIRLDNGQPIDTTSETTFKEFLENMKVRYTATLEDGTLTMVTQYFKDGVLAYKWSQKVTITSGNVKVGLTVDPNTNTWPTSGSQFVLANIDKSVISSIDTEAVTVPGKDYEPSTGIQNDIEGATITLSGAATKLEENDDQGNTHYVAFRINFSQALDPSTTAVVMNGDAEVTNAYAVWAASGAYNAMVVYIPLKAGEAYDTFIIDLTNFAAATLQADITVDVKNVAVSDVTATPTGADNLNLGAGSFTIEYAVEGGTLPEGATLDVNGTTVALSAITASDTALKDYLSVKKTAGDAAGSSITLTFTKAEAKLDAVVPGYIINLKNGESVIANTQIAAPIALCTGFNTEVKSGSKWYAKAEGTTLYLFTDTNANPATLPLNVNAGHVTDPEKLGVSDLGYTYSNGAINFRATKATSPLVEHATGIYTASGRAFLAVLKIDLSSLSIGADTEYGFAIETAGEGYCEVAANRSIEVKSSDPATEVTVLEATCSTNGVTAKGNKASKDECTYYGHIEYPTTDHDWTGTASDNKGFDEAQECVNCGAVKYSQSNLTQSWGAGTEYNWNSGGNTWVTFGVVHKGGYYEITGTTASGQGNLWEFNEPGLTDVKDTFADGFRADNFVQGDNSNLPWSWVDGTGPINATYAFNDAKNPSFSYSFGNLETAIKTHLNDATTTYRFDYTDASKIVITMHLVNGDDMDFTVTVTLTSPEALLDTYYLAFHPDCSVFTASTVETVVPEGKEVPTALTKHVHGNWNEQDRCPEDNVLNPNHGDVSKGGKAHSYDATLHCTICGQLNPDHKSHTYDQNGDATCVCGAVNPNHTHNYENGACKYCSWVQEDVTEAGFTAVTDKNEAITNFNSRWYAVPVQLGADDGLTVGKKLIVVGSQTSAMAENYHAVCWEVLAGYTGRADAYGWTFDPDANDGDGVTAFGTVVNATSITNLGVEDAKGSDIWATFKKIGASANWRVEFNYKDAETLIVTVTVSAATSDAGSLVYNCVYTCPIVNAAMIQRFQTIWIGAEAVTNLTVKGYKLV